MAKRRAKKAEKTPAKKRTSAALTSKKWRIVNRQQLAVLMGVHPDTVTHSAKDGMPVLDPGGRGKESRYDAVECLDWQRQRIGKNAREAAQTRLFTRNAEIAEMKLAQLRGELVPLVEVQKAGQAQVLAWRGKVLGLSRRMVQLGAIPATSEARAKEACRDVLTEISEFRGMDEYHLAAQGASQ